MRFHYLVQSFSGIKYVGIQNIDGSFDVIKCDMYMWYLGIQEAVYIYIYIKSCMKRV